MVTVTAFDSIFSFTTDERGDPPSAGRPGGFISDGVEDGADTNDRVDKARELGKGSCSGIPFSASLGFEAEDMWRSTMCWRRANCGREPV